MTWTDDKLTRASKMWRDGSSAGQIAAALGMTRSAICGIASRHRERFPAKGRGSQTSKINPRPRASSPWTEGVIKRAVYLWIAGASAAEIAAEIGVSERNFLQATVRMRDRFPLRRGRTKQPKAVEAIGEPVEMPSFEAVSPSQNSANDLSRFQIAGRARVAFADLLASQCRFPLECMEVRSGPDTPCCGADTEDPLSGYCGAHRSVMRKVA